MPIDVFHLFPELAAIGRQQLQACCDEWLRRPIARQCGVSAINVDNELLDSINLDAARVTKVGKRIFLPIDELLGYIVEHYFPDANERRRLHRIISDTRYNWAEMDRDYGATVARRGKLYLTCKNPDCQAELETGHEGVEGWTVTCPPTVLTCPACGVSATYDGSDLHLLAPK